MAKKPNGLDTRSTINRIKGATEFAISIEQQGVHDPTQHQQQVKEQMEGLKKVFEEQIAKGDALAQKMKEKGSDYLAQQTTNLADAFKTIENEFNQESNLIQSLNQEHHIQDIVDRARKKREGEKKRRRVVKSTLDIDTPTDKGPSK